MFKSKLILIIMLGLSLSIIGLPGCSSKKKVAVVQKPAPKEPEKKPAPQPQVKEVPQKVEKSEEVPAVPKNLRFGTVYFDFDKSTIRDDQKSTLNRNAQLLSEYGTVKIMIEGHCDERGTNEYNLALGQRRADAAKNYLIDYGINSSRISTVSYGEERPVDRGHDETSWAKNRRSEFNVTSPKLTSR